MFGQKTCSHCHIEYLEETRLCSHCDENYCVKLIMKKRGALNDGSKPTKKLRSSVVSLFLFLNLVKIHVINC